MRRRSLLRLIGAGALAAAAAPRLAASRPAANRASRGPLVWSDDFERFDAKSGARRRMGGRTATAISTNGRPTWSPSRTRPCAWASSAGRQVVRRPGAHPRHRSLDLRLLRDPRPAAGRRRLVVRALDDAASATTMATGRTPARSTSSNTWASPPRSAQPTVPSTSRPTLPAPTATNIALPGPMAERATGRATGIPGAASGSRGKTAVRLSASTSTASSTAPSRRRNGRPPPAADRAALSTAPST